MEIHHNTVFEALITAATEVEASFSQAESETLQTTALLWGQTHRPYARSPRDLAGFVGELLLSALSNCQPGDVPLQESEQRGISPGG